MKRKLLLLLLAIASALCLAFALPACDLSGADTTNKHEQGGATLPDEGANSPGDGDTITPDVHTHRYSEWVVFTQPTCETEGTELRTCNCGYREARSISALGHDYIDHEG